MERSFIINPRSTESEIVVRVEGLRYFHKWLMFITTAKLKFPPSAKSIACWCNFSLASGSRESGLASLPMASRRPRGNDFRDSNLTEGDTLRLDFPVRSPPPLAECGGFTIPLQSSLFTLLLAIRERERWPFDFPQRVPRSRKLSPLTAPAGGFH